MNGIVLKTTGSWYTVLGENNSYYSCKLRGKIRLKEGKTTNPVTVGDRVNIDVEPDNRTGNITEVFERKNYIIRRSSNLSREAHVIAANIDRAILVATIAFPTTHTEFIDRYLATAEAYRIPATIVFNKIDLYKASETDELNRLLNIYNQLYPCLTVSAITGAGMDGLRNLLYGQVTLISGNSGVGKSTLINAIDPDLKLKTASISDYHLKGKHTTTFSEMFALSGGGFVIDTPGIKGFGIVDMKRDEVFHFFPEIFFAAKSCQFYNCIHIHEPGCDVVRAVQDGIISESRYKSYVSIVSDTASKYR